MGLFQRKSIGKRLLKIKFIRRIGNYVNKKGCS